MRKKFSMAWRKSKQARKQRKYRYNAPLHIRQKFMSANLSKELRRKYGRRSFPVRKGDSIKIICGKFKGKKGKISEINVKRNYVFVEGIQIARKDGTKINVKIKPWILQIQELMLEDKKRLKAITKKQQKTNEKGKEKEEGKAGERKIKMEKGKIKEEKEK